MPVAHPRPYNLAIFEGARARVRRRMTAAVHVLKVWGEFACFTSPVTKVERFSYPCPTPSATRGIFDAIYCKAAEFRWQVRHIEVLEFPRYIALRRNEVKEKASVDAIAGWASGREEPEPIWADGTEDLTGSDRKGRTQRQTMALKRVSYRLHGEIRPWPGFERQQAAFDAQFRRRASAGKCVWQPYFGMREFPAYFELVEAGGSGEPPVTWNQDLGLMLYDVFDLSRPGTPYDRPAVSVFRARATAGVVEVPDYASADVLKPVTGASR